MTKDSPASLAALGFRVKSGWATAVLLTGSVQSPQVADRRTIDLCDPAIPDSRQPYHAAIGKLETDEAKVEPLLKVVDQAAKRSFTKLMDECRDAGHSVRGIGLVVGSEIDPSKIANQHIRAHALEGRLFRTVLEDAARSCGLACLVLVERTAYAKAAELLKRSEQDLKRSVAQLGRELGGPWRSDEKMAALVAWLALA